MELDPADMAEGTEQALLEMDHAIWRIACSYSQSREEAEDIAQSARLRIWEARGQFCGRSNVRTWMYRIALNVASDHRRFRLRHEQSVLNEEFAAPEQDWSPLFDLRRALSRLSVRQRQVVTLRELEHLSYKEIAEALGLSVGTVESTLFDARRKLRRLLSVKED